MRNYERQYIDAVIQDLAASIANHLRGGIDAESFVADAEHLTDEGWMFVYGYVASRLTLLRAATSGNPNLSEGDLEQVQSCIHEHEANIAAELYA